MCVRVVAIYSRIAMINNLVADFDDALPSDSIIFRISGLISKAPGWNIIFKLRLINL